MRCDQPTVVTLIQLSNEVLNRIKARYRVLGPFGDNPIGELSNLEELGEVRAVITGIRFGFNRKFAELLPNVQLVCTYGAGFDHVDMDLLREKGIRFATGGSANAACVADMAMALLLAVSLRLVDANRFVKSGSWKSVPSGEWAISPGFGGKRLGILGLGEIGRRIARRAEGFDLDIGYSNRRRNPESPYSYFPTATALADWSDYLVVSCPQNEQSFHAINKEVLQALGPEGILINIGRGAVVDQSALIEALKTHAIAGAGLDVLEGEPAVPAELIAASNVVLTPHIAGWTELAKKRLAEQLERNLAELAREQP